MDKPELEFYDIRSKTKFKTTEWRVESKSTGRRTRYFGVALTPNGEGRESWRIISKDFALQYIEKEETDEEKDTTDNVSDPVA